MRNIYLASVLVVVTLLICWRAIVPVEKKLKLGKDLSGGVSLTYSVQIRPDENAQNVLDQTIKVLKERINPNGTLDITFVAQGRDRIEVTMPLPPAKVKALHQKFEDELANLGKDAVSPARFDQFMHQPADQRAAQIATIAKANPLQGEKLGKAATAYDAAVAARKALEDAKTATGPERDALVNAAGAAADEQDKAREEYFKSVVSADEIRRVLSLNDQDRVLEDPSATDPAKQKVVIPGPRKRGMARLLAAHPDAKPQVERVLKVYEEYVAERTTLDDPQDLIRMLKGAGVLTFRISIDPIGSSAQNTHPDEMSLREQLRARGPKSVRSTDARWYKINKLEGWYENAQQLRNLEQFPAEYFRQRGYVAEEYDGEYYMLCWDRHGLRLTPAEGQWAVARAFQTQDELNRRAIGFEMDPRGGTLLGDLTQEPSKIHSKMAVLLDDEVYTAPSLQSAISRSGRITGNFEQSEVDYVVRVLNAGSLQAKLSPEPLSTQQIGPELGSDNLRMGMHAGLIALLLVAGFMVVYYFQAGAIAVVALLFNAILILGAMAMSKAAFTMPGIAGVILTFGQAVDSNVLIYERLREELQRGVDFKHAVHLAFSRALSPIMDGNISNLIICLVLYSFGTEEIRGFAVTLGIGVVTTLFTALVVTRLIFDICIRYFGWRKSSQLPMAIPALQRALTPHIDWMKHRHTLLGGLIIFLVAGGVIVYQRGAGMLGTEFRGGAEVELQFKNDEKTSQPLTLTRQQVHERLVELARNAPQGDDLRVLDQAEVLPVNPRDDGVTSDRFRIRTAPANEKVILAAIARRFDDVTESRGALTFDGANTTDPTGHVFPLIAKSLQDNLERPIATGDITPYLDGAAIVIEHLDPPPTRAALQARLERTRRQTEYAGTLSRTRELRVAEGTDDAVKSAILLVRDENISAIDNPERWKMDVANFEWKLVNESLSHTSQLASVQTFSPSIAATFTAHAILTIVISLLLLTVYVWVRFGTVRWAIAATVPLFADVIGIAGLIGLAAILYNNPSTGNTARILGLLPFKFDLAQIAALLTIVGYSLNDKIIILDRIRENKGRLPYASYEVINNSINQTLSRTLITAGAHLITTVILYLYGGEAVRGFAYTFNLGVILGTYTSIVSSPLVWSHEHEKKLEASAVVPAT